MLKSHIGASIPPFTMVDDSMEISSEHGHNIGDEDIDIDIDFTAGQADEDYVLEDVALHVELDDDFRSQPSPAVGNDDLMIDEADVTRMDDTDITHDEEVQNMDLEAAATSFATTDASEIPFDDIEASEALDATHFVEASGTETEVTWENNDAPNDSIAEADVPLQGYGETIHHEDVERLNSISRSAEVQQTYHSPNGSQVSASHGRSPTGSIPNQDPRNSSVNISESVNGSPEPAGDKADISAGNTPLSNEVDEAVNNQEVIPSLVDELSSSSKIPNVVVSYQNTEYALFSTDELDDPDSFFLSDVSVLGKPLAHVFKAIRDVIREDLTDEDELCMSMGNLNLEIEETSTIVQDFTLAQILTLHEKLIGNDGIDSPPPFPIQLATRPNFSIRIAHLTAAAGEGKGLSELLAWDEHSDTPFNSAEVADYNHGDESNAELLEPADFEDEVEAKYEKVAESSVTSNGAISGADSSSTPELEPSQVLGIFRATNESSGTSVAQQVNPSTSQPSAKTRISDNGGFDEDGDLIDYSDEELDDSENHENTFSQASKLQTDDSRTYNGTSADLISPCLLPNTCFCSKCNDLLIAEYEALNEELRRRSISRAAEDSLHKNFSDQTEAIEDKDVGGDVGLETEAGVENSIEYESENGGESYELENIGSEHEDLLANGGHIYTEAEVEEYDTSLPRNDDLVGYEELDRKDQLSEAPHNFSTDGEVKASESVLENLEAQEDIDLGEDDDSQDQQLPRPSRGDSRLNRVQHSPLSNEKGSGKESTSAGNSLGFGDAIASESGTSEKTLEASAGVDDASEDEIGYDEDDNEDTSEIRQTVSDDVKDFLVPHDGPGKRQREDADLDGGTSMGSKEAKRPRS